MARSLWHVFALFPAALLLFPSPLVAADAQVRYEDGRLWVSSRSVPANLLFAKIADETGIRFIVEAAIESEAVTTEVDGMEIERAIRNVLAEIPQIAGHTMSYARDPAGSARLVEVSIYGHAHTAQKGTVFEATDPRSTPFANAEERRQRMIEAGVAEDTADKVLALTDEVQKLQATPAPGSYDPRDLSPESREQLQPLLDRGVSMERAVQMLLLQEKYQETLGELSKLQRDQLRSNAPSDE